MYLYVYTCISTCQHKRIYTYIHDVYVYVYIIIHIYGGQLAGEEGYGKRGNIYVNILFLCISIYVCVQTRFIFHIYIHVCIYIHIYMYIYTYIFLLYTGRSTDSFDGLFNPGSSDTRSRCIHLFICFTYMCILCMHILCMCKFL
jgi:hypothetical protein